MFNMPIVSERCTQPENSFLSVPMPSILISTTLPGFNVPTPTDVPQAMISPGNRVMS